MSLNKFYAAIAPCGLNCSKCFAKKDGEIQKNASSLKDNLGNFDIYAERFSTLLSNSAFELYPQFKEFLAFASEGQCEGCRIEVCQLFKDCNVRTCAKEKKVDFCYECPEFPCKKTGFDLHLERRWLANQKRIKEIGIEDYYNEQNLKSRYI